MFILKKKWLSIKNSFRKIKLNEFDLQAIYEMLSCGFPLSQAINLLINDKNRKVFENIQAYLETGTDVSIFFANYLKNDFAKHFNCFIPFESFNNSLGLAINLVFDDRKTAKMYQKNLQYPLIIFITLILGVYMFDMLVFPSLLDILKQFNSDDRIAMMLKGCLDFFCLGSLFTILIVLIIFMIVTKPSMQVKSYCFLHRFMHHSVIDNFISYDFVRYFKKCYEQGLSTRRILQIMKELKAKPLLVYLANIIDGKLSSGIVLEKAFDSEYIDEVLYRFMMLAVNTSSLDNILDSYLRLSEMKVEKSCKKVGIIMQLSSYIIITIVLIFIYQVLFLPLNIISSL